MQPDFTPGAAWATISTIAGKWYRRKSRALRQTACVGVDEKGRLMLETKTPGVRQLLEPVAYVLGNLARGEGFSGVTFQ